MREVTYLFDRVAKPVSNNDGQECAETVKDSHHSDLNATMKPALDIFGGFFDIRFTVMAGPLGVRVSLRTSRSLSHDLPLLLIEEVCCFEILGH